MHMALGRTLRMRRRLFLLVRLARKRRQLVFFFLSKFQDLTTSDSTVDQRSIVSHPFLRYLPQPDTMECVFFLALLALEEF